MLDRSTKLSLALVLFCILITGCAGHSPVAPSSIERQSAYQFTNQYSDHRGQQQFFQSSGGRIAYLDVTAVNESIDKPAPVLVMLHGVPSSSWLYRKMIPELQQHYRIIAIDLLGYGSSAKPNETSEHENSPHNTTGPYSSQQQATYVNELLTDLNIEKYSLMFHDMGGLVAWQLIGNEPQRLRDLIVLNTIIGKEGFNHPKMEKGMIARMMSQTFSSHLSSAAALKMTFKNMGLTEETELSEQECYGYVAPMKEGADQALYAFYTGFDHALFADIAKQQLNLSNVSGKILVLWGAKDNVLTTDQLPSFRNHFDTTGATKLRYKEVIYPDNAHFLPEEIPSELVAEIREFLL